MAILLALASIATVYSILGIITVTCWQPQTFGDAVLKFAVWPFLAFVGIAYHLGGGK